MELELSNRQCPAWRGFHRACCPHCPSCFTSFSSRTCFTTLFSQGFQGVGQAQGVAVTHAAKGVCSQWVWGCAHYALLYPISCILFFWNSLEFNYIITIITHDYSTNWGPKLMHSSGGSRDELACGRRWMATGLKGNLENQTYIRFHLFPLNSRIWGNTRNVQFFVQTRMDKKICLFGFPGIYMLYMHQRCISPTKKSPNPRIRRSLLSPYAPWPRDFVPSGAEHGRTGSSLWEFFHS